MKQPKRLNSRFPGTCNDCGAHVATGEPILWLRKNTIVCADCDAAGYDDAGNPIGTTTQSASTPAPAAGDAWASALAWDDKAPTPGASIGLAEPAKTKPAETKPAETKPAETKPAETKPAETPNVTELAAARIARTVATDRPQLSQSAAIVADLLVSLINALDRLDIDDTEALSTTCIHFANESASGSRRRLWQSIARTIH
jgi:hypothetical protein